MKYKALFGLLPPLTHWFMALAVLFSLIGINPASAAPAGTALQFNGTNEYVTFGNRSHCYVTNIPKIK